MGAKGACKMLMKLTTRLPKKTEATGKLFAQRFIDFNKLKFPLKAALRHALSASVYSMLKPK